MIVCKDKIPEDSCARVWRTKSRLVARFVLEKETVLDGSEWTVRVYRLRIADPAIDKTIKAGD